MVAPADWLIRLPVAATFIYHGLAKFPNIAAVAEMMGMPFIVWLAVALGEVAAGLVEHVRRGVDADGALDVRREVAEQDSGPRAEVDDAARGAHGLQEVGEVAVGRSHDAVTKGLPVVSAPAEEVARALGAPLEDTVTPDDPREPSRQRFAGGALAWSASGGVVDA